MRDLAGLARVAEAETARHRTLREAAATAAAAALSELVPGIDGGVARELVKSVAEAVGSKVAAAAIPGVTTLAQLRDWVRSAMRGPSAATQPTAAPGKGLSWNWQRADFELDPGDLSRRELYDVERQRKRLAEDRETVANEIERILVEERLRDRLSPEVVEKLEANLARLGESTPLSSNEISRIGADLWTAQRQLPEHPIERALPKPRSRAK